MDMTLQIKPYLQTDIQGYHTQERASYDNRCKPTRVKATWGILYKDWSGEIFLLVFLPWHHSRVYEFPKVNYRIEVSLIGITRSMDRMQDLSEAEGEPSVPCWALTRYCWDPEHGQPELVCGEKDRLGRPSPTHWAQLTLSVTFVEDKDFRTMKLYTQVQDRQLLHHLYVYVQAWSLNI